MAGADALAALSGAAVVASQLRCADDGRESIALIDQRLEALGVEPPQAGQRGLFRRGLRAWLAQGAGRIEGVRAGRAVESWFFPAPGDEPYAFVHVRDQLASAADLKALGSDSVGHARDRAAVGRELPTAGRLRALVGQLVQLRPILEDPSRAIYLEQPGHAPCTISYPAPEPDPDRPVLFDAEVPVAANVAARIVVRRAKEPLSRGFSRATRRSGLVIRSGRAAHETTLAGFEGAPRPAPVQRGVLRGDRAAAARRARPAPARARGQGRPLRAQRASPDRRAAVPGDRPGAEANRRRRGAARRAHLIGAPRTDHRPRPSQPARAQPAQGGV